MEVRKAIIPAAGLGARLLPLSEKAPKELFPLGRHRVMDYAIREAAWSGIEEVCIVVSPQKGQIRERYGGDHQRLVRELGDIPGTMNISFVEQNRPRGLGDAIWTARAFTDGQPFAVLLPDNVFLANVPPTGQLKKLFAERPACCVGTMRMPANQAIFFASSRKLLYQEVDPGVYKVERFLDDDPSPAQAGEIRSIGRYILTAEFYDYCGRARANVREELRETDVLGEYLADGKELYGALIDGERFDTGSMEGYCKAFVSFVDRGL
ncbi:sugar phosphate nucleotidyltransferase [Candidatus Zixiibacteriota bacterium]